MTTKLDDISASIGALQVEVIGLRRDLQASELRSVESNSRADQHRATIHRRVDELVDDVGKLDTKVSTMEAAVVDSKAVTDKVKQWEQRGIGALFVSGIAGTALGGTVVGFIVYWWDAIMKLLRTG